MLFSLREYFIMAFSRKIMCLNLWHFLTDFFRAGEIKKYLHIILCPFKEHASALGQVLISINL